VKPPTSAPYRAPSPATRAWTCCASTSSATCTSTRAAPSWLFQILTEREERASVAVATNAPFSEWGQTFTDPRLAAAVVDRLTFHAYIIETGTQSYRLRTAQQAKQAGSGR
jgi:DNA replication protein DnaC